jgi:trans-L-3-hydroxyproline dehydratase
LTRIDGFLTSRNACVVKPGKLDRSPTGTGCSALMAVLHAKGLMQVGDSYIGRSVIDSKFEGRISSETTVGNHKAIIPQITGRAWISGQTTLMLDPDDPYPDGYKVSDTWPNSSST